MEIPNTPPRQMDLSMSESPDKQALQAEISSLKAKMNFVLNQSKTALSSQDATFRRLAKAYEQEARDINASELAQRTAELESEYASSMHHVETNIHNEANLMLNNQQQTVVAQAELHIQSQQQHMLLIEQEEAHAFRAQLQNLEQHASSKYDQLRSEATDAVQQQQGRLGALWSELTEARGVSERHEQARKQHQHVMKALENHNQELRDQVVQQKNQMAALEHMVQQLQQQQPDQNLSNDDDEKEELRQELEALQNAMQDLQIRNKELSDELASAVQNDRDWQVVAEDPPVYIYRKYRDYYLDPDQDDEQIEAEFYSLPIFFKSEDGLFEMRGNPVSGNYISRMDDKHSARHRNTESDTHATPPPPDPHPSPRVPAERRNANQVLGGSTTVPNSLTYKEADSIAIEKLPNSNTLRSWKMTLNRAIMAASGKPQQALAWILKADAAERLEDLQDDEGFDTLSVKLASALMSLMKADFKRQVILKEEELMKEGKMLNGRQMYWMCIKDVERPQQETKILGFEELLNLELEKDNLKRFQTEWDKTLLHLAEQPQEGFLETLYHRQIIKSTEFQQTMSLYNLENVQKGTQPSYSRLREMVIAFLNDKRVQRNSGKPHGSGSAAKQGPGQGDCPQFYKTGKCSRQPCPYSHNVTNANTGKPKGAKGGKGDDTKGKGKGGKGQDRGRSETRQEPNTSRGNSLNKNKQPTRGTSPSGKKDVKACFNYMKDKCTKGKQCNYWHPKPCRDGKKCKLGKECVFYHPPKAAAAKDSDKSEDETPKKKSGKKRDQTPPAKGKGQIAVASPLNRQGSSLA